MKRLLEIVLEEPFERDIKAIDRKALDTAMGGRDKPPEEPLLSTFEEGFGYSTAAVVGRSLKRYEFVRKVRLCELPHLNPYFDHCVQLSWASSSSLWLAM